MGVNACWRLKRAGPYFRRRCHLGCIVPLPCFLDGGTDLGKGLAKTELVIDWPRLVDNGLVETGWSTTKIRSYPNPSCPTLALGTTFLMSMIVSPASASGVVPPSLEGF
ncbi:hypothetical protein BHE74_00000465 [Ensete ventricosum]|nr:hypothetical protein BHE74_00000465 [Ensete ventricosum]